MPRFHRTGAGIIALTVLSALIGCRSRVYTSKAGPFSAVTLKFLQVYYFPPEKTAEAIINEMQDLDVAGVLADRYHIREQKSYRAYLFEETRARWRSTLTHYGNQKFGTTFRYEQVENDIGVESDRERAAQTLEAARRSVGGRVFLKGGESSIVLGKSEGGNITLADLHGVLKGEEFSQLIAAEKSGLRDKINEAVYFYAAKRLHDRIIREKDVPLSELERMDHNRVSDLFLRQKYYMTFKDIYPTTRLLVKFRPEELYRYFHRNRVKYMTLKSFQWEFTVVKDNAMAQQFMDALSYGKSFAEAAGRFGLKPFHRITRRTSIVARMSESESSARDPVKAGESLALSQAHQNLMEAAVKQIGGHWIIGRVLKITYNEPENMDFAPYRQRVYQDYQKELFRDQYETDLTLVRRELGFSR